MAIQQLPKFTESPSSQHQAPKSLALSGSSTPALTATAAKQFVPALDSYTSDFVKIIIANTSQGGQLLYLDDTGAIASTSSVSLAPQEKATWSSDFCRDDYNGMPRKGISLLASASGATAFVSYQ